MAVTCAEDSPDSSVDPRFGRCQYFMILSPEGALQAVPNMARELGNGAGIQAAQEMIDRNVDAVITGDVGPNAFSVLSAGEIDVYVGFAGTVREAIERFRSGDLVRAGSPTARGHHGMGRGARRNRP